MSIATTESASAEQFARQQKIKKKRGRAKKLKKSAKWTPFFRTRMLNLIIDENLYDEVVLAKRLGVSQELVRSALGSLRDTWREDNQRLFELYMSRQLSEIETMKAAIFDWAIGRQRVRQRDPVTKKLIWVTPPASLNHIDSMLKLMEREARLMGLDRQPLPALPPSTTPVIDLTLLSDDELLSLEVIHLKLQRGPSDRPAPPNHPGSDQDHVGRESPRPGPINLSITNGVYTNGHARDERDAAPPTG